MKKFRENASIVHNAAAKRKIAANLVKKESSTQLRIFNTLFTAQDSFEDEEENETIQKKREKEKKLESVIQARIVQREAEEKEREAATTTSATATKDENDRESFEKKEKDLFAHLSPISSTEDECEKKPMQPKIRKIIFHRVQAEIKELQPWIIVDPLPTGSNKPEVTDICIQTEYFTAPTTNKAINTEDLEITDSEAQYEMEFPPTESSKSAFETIMEELSEEIYLTQLLAIREKDYSVKRTIVIKPESFIDAKIVDFKYLKMHDSFLLLLQNNETYGIEKWSLKNLIKPKFIKTFNNADSNHVLTFDANDDHTVIISGYAFFCISTLTGILTSTLNISHLCVPYSVSLTKDIFVLASADKFYVFSFENYQLLQTFNRSKLTDTVQQIYLHGSFIFVITKTFLSMYNTVTGVHVNSKKFPFNNSTQNNSKRVIPRFCVLKNGNLLAFNPFSNAAVIINPENFANFSLFEYDFTFTSNTVPLGFTAFNDEIFSINFEGEISQWELLKKHRKIRTKIFKSKIEKPLKIKATGSNVFVISTSQKLSVLILPD